MSGNDDNGEQQDIVINELGVLKTSTVEGRGTNYILTSLSAEQIGALLAKRFADKDLSYTQDAKNPAKFTIEIEVIDKLRRDSGDLEPVDACTMQVKVMQAEESPDVQVVEFQRQMGSSLLFYSELAECRMIFAA